MNKDLLYSMGHYTQYFIITYKRKESEKEQIHVLQNHCSVYLNLTQHCNSTVFQVEKIKQKKKITELCFLPLDLPSCERNGGRLRRHFQGKNIL